MSYRLRPAAAEEAALIQKIIRQAKINPTGLDWRRFILAVDAEGRVAGCGQLKPHGDAVELASIAVLPEFQGQGIARLLIEHLIQAHPGDLYLMCRPVLQPFYEKFGFHTADESELPAYFRRIAAIFNRLRRIVKNAPGPLIMKRTKN